MRRLIALILVAIPAATAAAQGSRGPVRVRGVQLHLERSPSTVGQGDDDVDFVLVLVSPVVHLSPQLLRVDPEIAHDEVLEDEAGGVQVSQKVGGPWPSAATAIEGSTK